MIPDIFLNTKVLMFFSPQITMRREDRRDPEKRYNLMTVGQLSKNFSGVSQSQQSSVEGAVRHRSACKSCRQLIGHQTGVLTQSRSKLIEIDFFSTRFYLHWSVGSRDILESDMSDREFRPSQSNLNNQCINQAKYTVRLCQLVLCVPIYM